MSLLITVIKSKYPIKIAILTTPSITLKRIGFSMLSPSRNPMPFVPQTGTARKSKNASPIPKIMVNAISFLDRSSSSPKAMLVERARAFMPSQRVSVRETKPRIMGSLKSLLLWVIERNGSVETSTVPAGVLTAIPQKLGERIKTPSMTACPPTLNVGPLLAAAGEPALEPLHPAARVYYTLLARVERVAVRADVQMHLLARRRARLELVAARASHDRFRILLGMYARLHQKPPSAVYDYHFVYDYHLFYYACKGRGK